MEEAQEADTVATDIPFGGSRPTWYQTTRHPDGPTRDHWHTTLLTDFVVIPLKKKGYDTILGRGWLVTTKVNHNWKKNTLSMEKAGRKYVIDLRTQVIREELASSDPDSEDSNRWQWDSYECRDEM